MYVYLHYVRECWKSSGNRGIVSTGNVCKSQSYFTIDGLPSITSSWCQALWDPRPVYFSTEHMRLWLLSNVLSHKRMGLSFTIAVGPRQCSHSQIRVPRNYILLTQIWDSPNLEGKVLVFISPKNRVAQLYLQALSSLSVAPYDSLGYVEVIQPRLHTGFRSRL
jgi:hypothetical protein